MIFFSFFLKTVTTLAGIPKKAGTEDGDEKHATFEMPLAVGIHPFTGDVVVCDSQNR